MTLLCKCNWCGNVVEYDSDIKTLKFDDREYHYCKDCVLDVNVALSVGKNGSQGKYKLVWDCWEEFYKELVKWYKAPIGLSAVANRELRKAISEFSHKLNNLWESEE